MRIDLSAVGKTVAYCLIATALAALVAVPLAIWPVVSKPRDPDQQLWRVRLIALALEQYCNYDAGVMPPMTDTNTAAKAMAKYAQSPDFWHFSGRNGPIVPNRNLSGIKVKQLDPSRKVVAFVEMDLTNSKPQFAVYITRTKTPPYRVVSYATKF